MTPNRPYLLKGFFDWILDNELTPHLVANATMPHVQVPEQFIKDGKIVLNIAPSAVTNFSMDLEAVSFSARFGGSPFQIYLPVYAIEAIYARENGAGTMFEPEAGYQPEPEADLTALELAPEEEIGTDPEVAPPKPKGKPSLRVIK